MIFSLMNALRREPTKYFKMTHIDDDKDFSRTIEDRERDHEM